MGSTEQALDKMIGDGDSGKIDMIILNGDKKNCVENLKKALKLVRVGGVIAVNRVLCRG